MRAAGIETFGGSQALAKALVETERRVERSADEVEALRRGRDKVFRPPPIEWIKDRLNNIQQVLEQRTARSAQTLRSLLGPIRLELVTPDIGRPFYRASRRSTPRPIEEPPPAGAEGGSNSLRRWRRRELNPRPQSRKGGVYERSRRSDLENRGHDQLHVLFHAGRRGDTVDGTAQLAESAPLPGDVSHYLCWWCRLEQRAPRIVAAR